MRAKLSDRQRRLKKRLDRFRNVPSESPPCPRRRHHLQHHLALHLRPILVLVKAVRTKPPAALVTRLKADRKDLGTKKSAVVAVFFVNKWNQCYMMLSITEGLVL